MLCLHKKTISFLTKKHSSDRTQDRNVIGYSRDQSDAYVRAIYTQGKGRAAKQKACCQVL